MRLMVVIRGVPGPVQWHRATNETDPDQQTGKGSDVTFGIIITVAFLVCVLTVNSGIWLYERLVVLPRLDANAATDSSQSVRRASTAARRVEIQQLVWSETFSEWYAKKRMSQAALSRHIACAICLNEFADEQLVRDISCVHAFHTDCLDEWYARGHSQCPLCKGALCHPNPPM